MPSQPSSLPSKSKNNTTITIIRQPPSTATPRVRDQLIRVQLELMSDMAVDVALSPRIGSNNSLTITSNNSTDDFSTADAPSKISHHNKIGIVEATNNVSCSDTDNYANNNGNGSNNNNINSSGTSLSSPLFGSISSCIPNAARAIASMLSGTVARVTHDNHDAEESSASVTKVVSEVMYANRLSSSGNVDDYSNHQSITAAVSDVTNAAASFSSNGNQNNDATGEDSSSNNDYPQKNYSSSTVSHILVSLEDDHYKEIMWKHFRILGKTKDLDLSKIGNEILVEFKQQMSSNGRFYRRERDQEIEIDDDKALCSEYSQCIDHGCLSMVSAHT